MRDLKAAPIGPNFIRAWREYRDVSQPALAKATGLTASAIHQCETGATGYTQRTIEKISPVLQCSPVDLVGWPPGPRADIERMLNRASPQQIDEISLIIKTMLEIQDRRAATADSDGGASRPVPRRA